MPDLIIVAQVLAKPGAAKELVAAQTGFVNVARQQPGCLLYELFEDESQPGKVLFFERWKDRQSWDDHRQGAHMEVFRAATGHLIERIEILQMRQLA
ncbi:putative quinol monooxygenase [Variovorax sp. HJSM1_2]|uniref:putative quinol monooxygenase n=1 Tax=Variovorax sp. HJSM1_2 TaxID=3366263 RepID=UPI003BC0A1E0